MYRISRHLTCAALFVLGAIGSLPALSQEEQPSKVPHHHVNASVPEPKDTDTFRSLHQQYLERAKQGPTDLLFIGDSITRHWVEAPKVWDKYYSAYNATNFGISGDSTQNVLWRIDNGELDNVHPKVVVLMIGTNNTGTNTSEEILAADSLIVHKIQAKLPEAKILLLAIFPRGPRKAPGGGWDNGTKRMETIHAVNVGLAKLDNGRTIHFLNLESSFVGPDGQISNDVMPDQLHPSPKGYEIWAAAMKPLLDQMMMGRPESVSSH